MVVRNFTLSKKTSGWRKCIPNRVPTVLVGDFIKSPPSLLADGKDSSINHYFKMDVNFHLCIHIQGRTALITPYTFHHRFYFNLFHSSYTLGLHCFPHVANYLLLYYSNNNLFLIILVNQSSFRHSPFYSMLDSIIRLSSHKNHNSSFLPQSV